MADWKIDKQRTREGDFWICAEVQATYYTLRTRKPVRQRFQVYWTGTEWVDHAQYDRRKRFTPAEADREHAKPAPHVKLREYVERFFESE